MTESASRLNVEPWVELFLELELVVTVELDGLTLGIALGLAVTVTDNNWQDNSVYPERSCVN